jgi:hypothetical protein
MVRVSTMSKSASDRSWYVNVLRSSWFACAVLALLSGVLAVVFSKLAAEPAPIELVPISASGTTVFALSTESDGLYSIELDLSRCNDGSMMGGGLVSPQQIDVIVVRAADGAEIVRHQAPVLQTCHFVGANLQLAKGERYIATVVSTSGLATEGIRVSSHASERKGWLVWQALLMYVITPALAAVSLIAFCVFRFRRTRSEPV